VTPARRGFVARKADLANTDGVAGQRRIAMTSAVATDRRQTYT